MPPARDEPQRVTLAPAGLLVGAVALGTLVLMVVLLFLVLSSINSLESDLARTNERLGRTNEQLGLTNERIGGVKGDLEPLAELSPPFLRRGLPFLRTTGEDLDRLSTTIPRVERTLGALATAVVPFVEDLRTAPLGPAVARANGMLLDIERLSLLGDADGALEAVPEIRTSIDSLRGDFRGLLLVLCEMEEHLRSINRRSGGGVTEPEREGTPVPCRGRER